MNWEGMREQVQLWYARAAQFFLFQNLVLYLFACISAHAAIGLTGYIAFLDQCCHWVVR